jgi:hypothetical protein
MKRCPECRRDYYDDSLLYCLDDGTALLEGPASLEPATQILPDAITTEEGKTRTFDNTRTNIARSSKRRYLIIAAAVVFVLALGLAGYLYFGRESQQINSIAVLPFVNESGNAEIEYLSDGMTKLLSTTFRKYQIFR